MAKKTTVEQSAQIILYSDEFVFEEFAYGSLKEAQVGFERLKRDSSKAYQDDGIERRLFLVLSGWATDQDDDG